MYKFYNGTTDIIQYIQFVLNCLSYIFAIIGYSIYLELIILKFCGYDENIKDNIIIRGLLDSKQAFNREEGLTSENDSSFFSEFSLSLAQD